MLAEVSSLVREGVSSWTTLLLGLLLLCTAGYITYQTTLHPLAKYPGPFLAKLSSVYSVYRAIKGDRHTDLYELHRRHGTFVRYGPNHVSINSATALEQIYGHQANVKKSSYYSVYYKISIFNAVDKDVHARKRRVMSQAFSNKAIAGMTPHILSAIREWCVALGEDAEAGPGSPGPGKWTSPKDMAHWAAYMIFDVLGEICYGETFATSTKTDNRFFLDLMKEHVRFLNIIGQMRILAHMSLGTIFMRGSRENRRNQIAFSQSQLRKRLTHGGGRRDIIYFLQQARDPETGEGLEQDELLFETVLLLGAGSDTANTAFASIIFFLTHNPDVLDRLTDDVRTVFPDVESIVPGPLLSSMTYLRACVDESLRLCPPIPMPLPREVLTGGLTVEGHHFEAGCTVGTPTYALHHSKTHFERPFRYDPGRWLVKGGEGVKEGEGQSPETVREARQAFAPFSVGPRSCIGRNVALLELYVGLARMLWLYDLRLAPGFEGVGVGREGEYAMKDHFIVGKEGPVIQVRRAGARK